MGRVGRQFERGNAAGLNEPGARIACFELRNCASGFRCGAGNPCIDNPMSILDHTKRAIHQPTLARPLGRMSVPAYGVIC